MNFARPTLPRLSLVAALSACSVAFAAPVANGVFSLVAESQDGKPPGPPAAWKSARPELAGSRIATYAAAGWGADNAGAIAAIKAAIAADPKGEVQLAIVPGTSELLGHHTAWAKKLDNHWVEPEFRARLRHAYLLLEQGIVKGIVVSGGGIDKASPMYVEALAGFKELVEAYGARWKALPLSKGSRLEERVIVDPWAIHSEDNIRNGDRVTLLLGLDRNLVVTTGGKYSQGWWFAHHKATQMIGALAIRWGSFDSHSKKALGYTLGAFGAIAQSGNGPFGTGEAALPRINDAPKGFAKDAKKFLSGDRSSPPSMTGGKIIDTVAIAHWSLNTAAVLKDTRWELGANDKD